MDEHEHLARQYLEIGNDRVIVDATEPLEQHLGRDETDAALGRPGFFD